MASIQKKPNRPRPHVVHWRERGIQRTKAFEFRLQAEDFRRKVDGLERTGELWVDPRNDPSRHTVSEAAAAWLAARDEAPSTMARDRSYVASHLDRTPLGAMITVDVETAHVRDWLVERRRRYAASTVTKIRQILHQVLEVDVDDGRIDANPVDKTKPPPAKPRRKRRALTEPQILAIADAIDGRYRAMIIVAYTTGLRFGEVAGLRRSRIDLDAATLTIDAGLQRDGTLREQVKTETSAATVAMHPDVVAELRRHLAAYPVVGGDTLVFRTPRSLPIRYTAFRRQAWLRAVAAAGLVDGFGDRLEPTFHDLRRSTATILYRRGVDVTTAQSIMRHASAVTTIDIYTEVKLDDVRPHALPAPQTDPDVGRVLAEGDAGSGRVFGEGGETVAG